MVADFDDDERSTDKGRPIDLYVITTPTVTYRLTSYVVDVSYLGNTYTATTMNRGSQEVAQDLTGREQIIYLPITHPVIQRFAASGIPERTILVTLFRLQSRSGVATQQWQGFGQSLSIDGHVGAIRIPSITDDALRIRLPTVRAQRLCNHNLFDAGCRLDRTAFMVTARVVFINGTNLTLDTMGGNIDGWAAPSGEIVHTASGERRSVLQQIGTVLLLNAPFVDLALGEEMTVSASCDHSLFACRDKFNNVVNFGGMPHLNPAVSPWAPRGLGIIEQS